jgi:hypothetical protein
MSHSVFLSETRPKAAKRHTCYLCGYPIPKGTTHIKHVGIFDNDQYSVRMHDQCFAATRDWDSEDWENFGPTSTSEFLEDLTPEAREEILNLGKQKFTVLLRYPDYYTDTFPDDTYVGVAEAESWKEAAAKVQKYLFDQINQGCSGIIGDVNDLCVVFVVEGAPTFWCGHFR